MARVGAVRWKDRCRSGARQQSSLQTIARPQEFCPATSVFSLMCMFSIAQTLDNSDTQSKESTQINSQTSQSVEPKPLVQSNIRISCRMICTNGFLGANHEGHEDEVCHCEYRTGAVPSSCRAAAGVQVGDGGDEGQRDGSQAAVEACVRDDGEVGGESGIAFRARFGLVEG